MSHTGKQVLPRIYRGVYGKSDYRKIRYYLMSKLKYYKLFERLTFCTNIGNVFFFSTQLVLAIKKR